MPALQWTKMGLLRPAASRRTVLIKSKIVSVSCGTP
jgi:hypothetical protein